MLLGLIAGFCSAMMLGVLTMPQLRSSFSAPMFSMPHREHVTWNFAPAFVLTFLLASLSSMLKSVGDLTLCQKIDNTKWRRTDMKPVGGGILAGSLCSFFSGLVGGMGQSTFSSNVGLSIATGVTSRTLAYPTGVILILLAFFPKLAEMFAVMPAPVMGAVLIYVECFMIVGGFQVITSRMLDTRKTFVVGIPIIIGLSVEIVPSVYAGLPLLIRPIFASALAPATILVVILNVLFRIGVAKREVMELTPSPDSTESIFAFVEKQGSIWGMRPDVATRASSAIDEVVATLRQLPLQSPTVQVVAEYDEFKLKIDIEYEGPAPLLQESAPSLDELTEPRGEVAMAGFLIRQHADKVKVSSRNGHTCVHLRFEQ